MTSGMVEEEAVSLRESITEEIKIPEMSRNAHLTADTAAGGKDNIEDDPDARGSAESTYCSAY